MKYWTCLINYKLCQMFTLQLMLFILPSSWIPTETMWDSKFTSIWIHHISCNWIQKSVFRKLVFHSKTTLLPRHIWSFRHINSDFKYHWNLGSWSEYNLLISKSLTGLQQHQTPLYIATPTLYTLGKGIKY